VEVAIEQVRRDPLNAAGYPPLFQLLVRAGAVDRAWCVASVMNHLGTLGEAEAQLYRTYGAAPLGNMRGTLGPEAWPVLMHADLDPALTEVFEILAPAVSELRLAVMNWRERLAYPGSALPRSGPTGWIAGAVGTASAVLGIGAPKLFLRAGAGPALSVAATRPASLAVSPEQLDAIPASMQPFVLGKRVFELAPPLLARGLCPSVSELASLLASAGRLVAPRAAVSIAADEVLRGGLKKPDLDRLADAMSRAQAKTIEDVQKWSQLADLSTSRAGLLLTSDLELARGALTREGQLPGDLSVREQMKNLVVFAVSDAYAALRQAVGLAVRPPS
jgi:hypothetical protein